ncbi:MAG: nucleoside hydrolase, partial [Candidatus Aramenus sp.]|nr:nucleoside hydrolase [Candidatus Aramenus sp.]
ALNREVIKRSERQYVDVENCDCLTRGMTVIDYLDLWGKEPKAEVVYEIDKDKFMDMLFHLLSWF